jgi:hypothetical protein
MTLSYIPLVERLYREIATPKPPPQQPAPVAEAKPIALTRADVDAIIKRQRSASPNELQFMIDHARDLGLTDGERNQIGVDLSIAMAQRARQANSRRESPSTEFLSQVLGYAETPHGLIDRAWVNQQMRAGAQAIARCSNHRPPECQCWSVSRAILWQASSSGPKTPEGWAAVRVYEFLADLELASRPDDLARIQ